VFSILFIMFLASCNSQEQAVQKDYRDVLLENQLDFVNTRWQAYLCIQLVTFKNANSEEHFGRCNESEPASLWQPGKNGPPDHFLPISVDKAKVLVFRYLINLSYSGEGWSTLPAFPLFQTHLKLGGVWASDDVKPQCYANCLQIIKRAATK
jgi:hypothetical protein